MFLKSLNSSILRITTRYTNVYKYDVHIGEVLIGNNTLAYSFIGGYAAEIFQNLQEILGFSYLFVPEVGTFNFSLAQDHNIDIFVGSYSLYYTRALVVNPTFVIGNSKIIALINHVHEENIKDIFIHPFSKLLWAGLFSFFLACLAILVVIGKMDNYQLKDSVFNTMAILLQKECNWISNKFGVRLGISCISVCTIVIMASYTGNMFSIKAVNRFSINSLESLLKSKFKVIVEDGQLDSSIMVMLQGLLQLQTVKKLLKRISSAKYVYSTFENAIREVLVHPSAYIIDEETGVTTISNELGQFPCEWSAIPVLNLQYPWSMYMGKKSKFKAAINYGLLRLDESGIRRRLLNKWIPHATKCENAVTPFTSIILSQIYTAFLIYFGGLIFSFILCFVFERRKWNICRKICRRLQIRFKK